jgi:hypothetical protein
LQTANLTKLKEIRGRFNKRLLWSYAAIFGGLGLATWATIALDSGAEASVTNAGFLIALAATLFVGVAMILEGRATHAVEPTWHDYAVLAAQRSKLGAYQKLPLTVRWWRGAFQVMFWVAFAFFVILGIIVFASKTSPGVLFLALFLLTPTYLARRYSEDLMRLWSPDDDPKRTLDPLNYVKGTTTGREVFGYWLAFVGLLVINTLAGDNAVFPTNIVTPVLVLLSIGSTAKMLATGHKEFYEARDAVISKSSLTSSTTR